MADIKPKLQSQAGWKWYGFAGHHICGARCQYHLCTSINGAYLVSTVGRFVPDPLRAPGQTSTVGSERDYETFVFLMNGDDENGDPVIPSRDVVDSCGYTDSMQAEAGHYAMCEKWARVGGVPTKCDGNHRGPRCADPECWNDSPDAPPETIETAIQARKAAQEQLYAACERHADEVKRLQAEIGRLLAAQLSTPEPTINWRGTHFTYQNQPCDNVTCWRLGEAARGAKPGGDLIDHGLSLLQQLQKQGFGVFSLAAKTQPATTEHDCSRSHPHENMSPMCELRTEIARLRNENTRLKHSTTERKGETSIPAGWAVCRIEYEPGYPEDVAYGPPRMMDRLKKWLDKHFANTSPQVPEDHPLMVFAIECEMGALQEHEVPLRARLAIDAARKEPSHG